MKKIILLVSCLSLFFVSCSKKSKTEIPVMSNLAATRSVGTSNMKMSSKSVMAGADMEMEESMEIMADSADIERKIIKNGSVNVQVESFDNIEVSIKNFLNKYKGYTTNTYSYTNQMTFNIKVPAEVFDDAMDEIGDLGKVTFSSRNSQDVTDNYYDLESRINSKRILKEKLEGYLKQAKNLSEILETERQLNEVISELEYVEGRMKRLSNQIAYSDINLTLTLPTGYNQSGFEWPDLKDIFSTVGFNIVNFFSNILGVIVYIVVFGVPIIAIVALLYWLLFGRVGLLVKLFKFLSKKK